jgi:hypothetical protein
MTWWRVLVGGEFGVGEASSSQGTCGADRQRVADGFYLGEILVGSSDTEAVSPADDIFLPGGVVATLGPYHSICRGKP